ncbi:unnamed protein product [Lactuca saligna]|uniref:Uncharacterized protein n=1 Tax=Lactuca saligna TaxID=75948 RepID=A0AA35W0Y5_LACSI|nr:unnamed protein product [Lactuca saligna]
MLKKVDPTNSVFLAYKKTIDTIVSSYILLEKEKKKTRRGKKDESGSSKEPVKKTKRQKSPKKKSADVDDSIPQDVSVADNTMVKSKNSRKVSPHVVRKSHVTHQGVIIREVPVPVSPSSKKRWAENMAKHLQQKKSRKLQKLILGNISTDEEEVIPDTPEAILVSENLKDDDINVNISNTDTNVIMGSDNAKPDDSENAKIESPKTAKGDDQGIVIPTSEIIVSLPPITSNTDSPTFENIINTAFTSLFSSQSTDPPKTTSPVDETMENETDTKGFAGTSEALQFDNTKEEFPDDILMTMQQFKILNSKLNSILQTQADIGGGSSVSILEVDSMLKVFEGRVTTKVFGMIKESEARVLEKVDFNDQTNDNRMSSQRKDFLHEVKDLKAITGERHVLYVQEVKKVREDVNLQIEELREDMQKEVQVVQLDYASINQKVDIICNAVTRFVKLYETLNPQVINLYEQTAKHFDELVTLLKELKELLVKPISSSLITPKFLS